jgi:hypothetical protein
MVTVTKAATLDALASAQLDTQLAQVEDRLSRDYASATSDSVHELVEQERARFAHARIHVYVPILVERAVRETLTGSAAKHRRDRAAA